MFFPNYSATFVCGALQFFRNGPQSKLAK